MLKKSEPVTLTVTAKGQITLRKNVLIHLGVRPGDKIDIELLPEGRVSMQPARKGSIESFFGMLHDPDGPKLTIEDIKRITEEAWAGRQ